MTFRLPVFIPYDTLNDEGKRISKRGSRCNFSLLIGCVLSYSGLLLYIEIAPQPNLTLIDFWFVGTGAALGLGSIMITGYLNRTLPRYQVLDGIDDRTTDSS